ncbi:hypothetical protein PsorP6_007517 [Peronosclerospora sorghi]|uniref:Uncharacterized protein n=1 Tax=Peronosclerospora sorghi TaxID=230839 RepID=A0ACC0WC11_9STRA|nr:hypothetical protein PsorP6_007517 [Peronosclerospora sorghi]
MMIATLGKTICLSFASISVPPNCDTTTIFSLLHRLECHNVELPEEVATNRQTVFTPSAVHVLLIIEFVTLCLFIKISRSFEDRPIRGDDRISSGTHGCEDVVGLVFCKLNLDTERSAGPCPLDSSLQL